MANLPLPSILLDSMPAAGADGLVEIPIAVTGNWKRGETEFSISKFDLAQMAANFKRRKNGEINIDYDHASEMPEVAQGGPVPSAGRILKLRSNGALYAGVEFTARALSLIKAKEYRFVSPAIAWGVKDKATGDDQGTTLTSLALTNRPFLEELPPIKLSEIGSDGQRERADARGGATMSATDELIRLTRVKMKEEGKRYGDALVLVAKENPELASRYREEAQKPTPTVYLRQVPAPTPPATRALMEAVHAEMKASDVSFGEALVRVGRTRPELWTEHSNQVMDIES